VRASPDRPSRATANATSGACATPSLRLREDFGPERVFLGGHSYGGRVSTLAAAADPALCDALLLLAYPLHPPRKPGELRTGHFSALRTPCFFASGSRDPFGSPAELATALGGLNVPRELLVFDGAGHDLAMRRRAAGVAAAAPGDAAPATGGPHATAAGATAAGFLAFVASSVR
jgi:predicted alpha/beta-hydrolase family hydrolase